MGMRRPLPKMNVVTFTHDHTTVGRMTVIMMMFMAMVSMSVAVVMVMIVTMVVRMVMMPTLNLHFTLGTSANGTHNYSTSSSFIRISSP
jgi:uncharacterized protein YqhQ